MKLAILKILLLLMPMGLFTFASEEHNSVLQQAYERPIFVGNLNHSYQDYTGTSVTLIHPKYLSLHSETKIKVRGRSLERLINLCADDPYFGQSVYGSCSGCLIAPDLILTAGHCVEDSSDCHTTAVLFDFKENIIEKSDTFVCTEKLNIRNPHQADIAIIKIDRSASRPNVTNIRRSSMSEVGDELIVTGNPWGMHQAISMGTVSGFTRSAVTVGNPGPSEHNQVIQSNMPSFGGQSGACVFNKTSGALEGVLSHGAIELEFDKQKECYRTIPASKMPQVTQTPFSQIVPTSTFLQDLDRFTRGHESSPAVFDESVNQLQQEAAR